MNRETPMVANDATYNDGKNAVKRKLPLFKDRKNSVEAARSVERLVSARGSGDTVSSDLYRFIENTLPSVRSSLAEWGIIDSVRVAAVRSLEAHLKDWEE